MAVKRFKTKGRHIKELRERRERRATQKEFAYEVRISERQLRLIENRNKEITADVVDRIGKALGVPRQAIVFAIDQPRLVLTEGDELVAGHAATEEPERVLVPRFDTDIASVVRDEAALFSDAKDKHVVVSHVLTRLTAETECYAEDLLDNLQSVTKENRDSSAPIDGREELRLRRRLRELLVLLKGNDVWVYATTHFKYLPEKDVVSEKRDYSHVEMQVIVAFGPPGEYGEDTVEVPIDHGQPWVYDPNAKLF